MFTARYRWFWPGFDPRASFLHAALVRALGQHEIEIVQDESKLVDLEVSSVFIHRSRRQRLVRRAVMNWSGRAAVQRHSEMAFGFDPYARPHARKTLWYSGENVRPPFDSFSATLSSDATDETVGNLYWPFWLTRLDWGLGNRLSEIAPPPAELVRARNALSRPRSACMFSSTNEPARMRIAAAVTEAVPLTRFGRASGNFAESKMAAASSFGLQVCPENDLYPGYVTEKLVEAWWSRNVPIWQGLHGALKFNAEAIIDVTGLDSRAIQDRLRDTSAEELMWRQGQPLLTDEPILDPLLNFLAERLG